MKKVLITCFHPLISRNILSAGVLQALLDASVHVVIAVPANKENYFKNVYCGTYIEIVGVGIPRKRLESLLSIVSLALVGIENHVVRGWKTERKYIRYYFARLVFSLFAGNMSVKQTYRRIFRRYLFSEEFSSMFNSVMPDCVFSTDIFDPADRMLLIAARAKSIRTVGMLRSWDNPTTKGVLIAEPDHYMVTNEIVKEELVTIHGVDPDLVSIVGIPHYDSVLQPRARSRDNVFRDAGLNPAKKTLFYSPGGKILYKHDDEMLRMLKRVIDSGKIGHPVQVLVSIQPADTIDTSSIENDSNFVIHRFGVNVTGRKKESEMTPEDNEVLNDFLTYSDVLLTLVSTMAIDGTVFGKPVIVLGFDPFPGLADKVSKFARYVHFKKFLDTGLVTVSHSEDELARQLNAFLNDANSNKSARETIVEKYAYKLDGKSASRVVETLLEAVR